MRNRVRTFILGALCVSAAAVAADKKNEFRYNVGAAPSVRVVNEFGPVSIKGTPGHQVIISATTHSDKVEVDSNQIGGRIEVVTHFLSSTNSDEGRVDYSLTVPQDASVSVRAPGGPIDVQALHSDLVLEGDAAKVDVRDVGNGYVHVRTLSGPITLANITNGHVEVTSVNGDVQMNAVDGPEVSVNTTRGAIRYAGDFGSGGDYLLVNHSGDIDVIIPATASVDLSARSVKGSVEQDFPLQQKSHSPFALNARSFAGTSNSGASSVQLLSFSGRIRVRKQ